MCFDQRLTTSVGCGAHMIRVYARYHSQCLTSSRGFHLNPRLPLLLPQCCLLCDGWVAPVLKMPNVAIISSFFFRKISSERLNDIASRANLQLVENNGGNCYRRRHCGLFEYGASSQSRQHRGRSEGRRGYGRNHLKVSETLIRDC